MPAHDDGEQKEELKIIAHVMEESAKTIEEMKQDLMGKNDAAMGELVSDHVKEMERLEEKYARRNWDYFFVGISLGIACMIFGKPAVSKLM